MTAAILTLNAGSSSCKFSLYKIKDDDLALISHGQIEAIGSAPHFIARSPDGTILTEQRWPEGGELSHEVLLGGLIDWVKSHLDQAELIAVGHRVVHGGTQHHRPTRVTPALLDDLAQLSPLAPLHQPHNLAPIHAIAKLWPNLVQVACFDTGFHHGMPDIATHLPLPAEITALGVRRYGFHGLSYEYLSTRLAELSPSIADKRVLLAHLGNGASLCALTDGCSIDTTMGFTALDGLIMGTRCGAIDPGVILYLQQTHGMSVAAVETLLYQHAGLLGVSGVSQDMRTLMASPSPAARMAIQLFIYSIIRHSGALISTLGGLDALVFSAGIGENTPEIRSAVCARLGWVGVKLDEQANLHTQTGRISTPDSRVEVWVIPTDEEAMIAQHTLDLVQTPPSHNRITPHDSASPNTHH